MGHARLLVWYLGISKSIHLSPGIVTINMQYSARPKGQLINVYPQLLFTHLHTLCSIKPPLEATMMS